MTVYPNDKKGFSGKGFGISIVLTVMIAVSASQLTCFVLGILTYEKNSEAIFRSKYSIVQTNLIRDIEGSLRFGKDLKTFYGLTELLDTVMQDHTDLKNIVIYSAAQQVLHDMSGIGTRTNGRIPDTGIIGGIFGDSHIFSAITSAKGEVLGYVDFVVSNTPVNKRVIRVSKWAAVNMVAITLVSVLVMVVAFRLVAGSGNSGYFYKRWFSLTLIALVVATQFFSLYLISSRLVSEYKQHAQENGAFIENALGSEIEMLMSKGVRINRLVGVDQMMRDITAGLPEISSIGIFASDGSLLYGTIAGVQITDNVRPLIKSGETVGFIDTAISSEYVEKFSKTLVYDGLTTFVISLMFTTELLIFLFAYTNRQLSRISEKDEPRYDGFMRTAAASYLFGSTLAVSFIPLYIGTLNKTTGILDHFTSLLSSLPVSVEILFTIPMIIVAGIWMDRRGWHEPFIMGCSLTIVAAFVSGSVSDTTSFILARGLAGAGYGLTWTSAISFVLKHTNRKNRSSATASLVAGIITGQISGGAVGAMLADSIGARSVFFVAILLLLVPLVFSLVFMRDVFIKPEPTAKIPVRQNMRLIKKYLSSRNITSVLCLSIIPYSLCQMGLLLFAAPVYLNSLGVTQSGIGRVLMVYGATVVYVSPVIGKFADSAGHSRRKLIITGGVIGGLSLFLVVFIKGVISVVAALFLMGVASSILASSQLVFAYEQPVSDEIGSGVAVSLQRFADKLGQMLGPLLLGLIFSFTSVESGLGIVGGVFLIASFFFMVVTAKKYK